MTFKHFIICLLSNQQTTINVLIFLSGQPLHRLEKEALPQARGATYKLHCYYMPVFFASDINGKRYIRKSGK